MIRQLEIGHPSERGDAYREHNEREQAELARMVAKMARDAHRDTLADVAVAMAQAMRNITRKGA